MNWEIYYTEKALHDLEDIYEYLAIQSNEAEIAKKHIHRILDQISTLDNLPHRYRRISTEPYLSNNIHLMPVSKYLIYYTLDDYKHLVVILRIAGNGRMPELLFQKNDT